MSGPVVWALVHDLGRTGVPTSLARLAAWNAGQPGPSIELHVLAQRDGPWRSELEQVAASVTAVDPPAGRSPVSTVAAGLAQAGRPLWSDEVRSRDWHRRTRKLPTPDVVLLHGAGSWIVLRAVEARLPARVRRVVHLHELAVALDRCIPPDRQAELLSSADAVLAVCAPVADLAGDRGADPGRLHLVPGTVGAIGEAPAMPGPPEVVAIGEPGWRKGTDRFVALAHELRRVHPSVRCRWIGGERPPSAGWAVGAELPVAWQASGPDPWRTVPPGSVLVVPSREDPLPLVVLEAGQRGVAVVAAATGGLPDLLADGRGRVVPGHDLAALADTVVAVLNDHEGTAQRARALADWIDLHHTDRVVGPTWRAAVTGVSAGS